MKTLVKCPHCSADLEIEGEGKFGCSECGQTFRIGDEPEPPHVPPVQPMKIGTRQAKSRGTGWWTIFKVLGFLILIPALAMFAGCMVMMLTEDNKATGFLAVVLTIIPAAIGGTLYAIGSNASKETICSVCGENVGKHARVCKTCNARLAE